ncbi:MAG: GYD domain-containing protein [Thermodesulfobacteriota bacterium]
MPAFIMMGKYSSQAMKLISARRTANAQEIIGKCGGKLVTGYATMGETDIVMVMDFPGIHEALKASIALNKALGISFTTLPALPIEDFDKLVGGKK